MGLLYRHVESVPQQGRWRFHVLHLDQERIVRGAVQPPGRQPFDLHVPGHHWRRRPDHHVRGRIHGGGERRELCPLLHIHGRVHLLDAAAGPGGELRVPHRRLGDGGPQLLLPDRLLVPPPLCGARGPQGVRDERDRRHRHDPWRLRPLRHIPRNYIFRRLRGRQSVRPAFAPLMPGPPARFRPARACRFPPARRCGCKVGPDPAPHLAAGCHGGPHPRQRPHPRRHDGHRRRLFDWAHAPDLRQRRLCTRGRRHHRRGYRPLRRLDRHRPDRYQARARLLDDEPDRLHVPGGRHRSLLRRLLPPHVPRLLQGPALHGRRQRHSRHARRAGHAQVRRAVPPDSPHVLGLSDRLSVARGHHPLRRILLEGADPRRGFLET